MAELLSSGSSSSFEGERPSEYEQVRLSNMRRNREIFEENGFGDPYPGVNLDPSKTEEVTFDYS